MLASSWWTRGGGTLALLAVLTGGLIRPAPAAPHAQLRRRAAVAKGQPVATAAAAGGAMGGSGTVVGWGGEPSYRAPAGLTEVIGVGAGIQFGAALRSNGTVTTWGAGPGVQAPVPANLTGVKAISVGWYHTLALKSDGTVVAWGGDGYGQSDVPPDLTGVRAVAAGAYHSLALKSDGTVVGWGLSSFGLTTSPAGLSNVVAIAAGYHHSMALKSDGTVVVWGQTNLGVTDVPADLTGVTAIAAGETHCLALKSDGTVVAWGLDRFGETHVPDGLAGVTAVSCSVTHNLALKSDGTLVAWGNNVSGQSDVSGLTGVTAIADGGTQCVALRSTSRVQVWGAGYANPVPAGLSSVKAVSTNMHTFILRPDGTLAVWGRNNEGQATVPAGLTGVTDITAGVFHSAALKSDGTVVAWGNSIVPTEVPRGLRDVKAVSAGGFHTLALKSDGTVVAWGSGNAEATVPNGLTNVVAIAAGYQHNLALEGDGTVVAWGSGDAATVPAGLHDVVAISAGNYHSLALKSDGTVVAWGRASEGQLDIPSGLGDVKALSAGIWHNLALKSDGTVAAWGSPTGATAVPADLTGVSAIAAGECSFALVVNQAPVLTVSGSLTTLEDTTSGSMSFTVADDGGAEGVLVTAAASVSGLVQSVTFSGTGASRSLTITPAADANGTAVITLTATDGVFSTTGTFGLTVTPVNDAPSFTRGADRTVSEDAGPQSVSGWATNRKPGPTSDELTQTLTFQVTANSNPGLFSAGPAVDGTTGELTYTPKADAYGQATVTLRAHDDGGTANGGQDTSATQTFKITVTAVQDAPTASNQSVTTAEDMPRAITLGASDVDGDALSYTVLAPPAHGTLTGSGADRTYTPAANYHGPDSFTFKVNDGTVDSNTATVSLTVTPVNDLPVATDESYATLRGTALEIAAPGVLGNDTDIEGDPLTAQLVTSTAGGTLTLNVNGGFRYVPRIDFSGTDTFTYRPHDGTAAGSAVTVTIQVSAAPPASTPDGQVDASGTIPVPGGNATFNLSARKTGGKVQGTLSYTDPLRTRTLTSTELTVLVVTGRKARVFGKGKLVNGTVVDFVIDVEDVAEPGRGKDRFQLEATALPPLGAVLSLGNVVVQPR